MARPAELPQGQQQQVRLSRTAAGVAAGTPACHCPQMKGRGDSTVGTHTCAGCGCPHIARTCLVLPCRRQKKPEGGAAAGDDAEEVEEGDGSS